MYVANFLKKSGTVFFNVIRSECPLSYEPPDLLCDLVHIIFRHLQGCPLLPITLGLFLTGNMRSRVRVYQRGQGFNVSELLSGRIISYRIYYIIENNLEKVTLE